MKYELIKEGDLFRIRALRDFGRVRAGDLGGLVSGPNNLSQEGGCWIDYDAQVRDDARVLDNAQVCDHAQVYDSAWVCDYALVAGRAQVVGDTVVVGHTLVYCYGQVPGNTVIRSSER